MHLTMYTHFLVTFTQFIQYIAEYFRQIGVKLQVFAGRRMDESQCARMEQLTVHLNAFDL